MYDKVMQGGQQQERDIKKLYRIQREREMVTSKR